MIMVAAAILTVQYLDLQFRYMTLEKVSILITAYNKYLL